MQRNKIKNRYAGKGLLNKAINALPFELHLPGYQFCGPGTHLEQRLHRHEKGINPLDAACRQHDIQYSIHKDNLNARHKADKILENNAASRIISKNAKLAEKVAAAATWLAMKIKRKMGAGVRTAGGGKPSKKKKKKNVKKKRYIPAPNKYGGFLPLLPLLGVLGSLAGGAAGIAKAVNDSKANSRQLAELQRHNRVLEGRGLYLNPYKTSQSGKGFERKKKKKTAKKEVKINLPSRGSTSSGELNRACRDIPYFRGVFMRTKLPSKPWLRECGIVNLDCAEGAGTHWVAYIKNLDHIKYFDSFGNLRPPIELEKYFERNRNTITYNYERLQKYNSSICGQLCVKFLLKHTTKCR